MTTGIDEMDADIVPTLGGLGVIPRVLSSYALLFWFTIQVNK